MSTIHHATLVRSSSVSEYSVDDVNGLDLHDLYVERFGIDDARQLVQRAYKRPLNSSVLLLVVKTNFITHEAQNALLKVLEEPPLSTKFIFVIPVEFNLLPTLRSRFNEDKKVSNLCEGKSVFFTSFLEMDYCDRLMVIDQAIKKKDLDWQRKIKRDLILHTGTILDRDRNTKFLYAIEFVARTLLTRGASNKMLLEHVALII